MIKRPAPYIDFIEAEAQASCVIQMNKNTHVANSPWGCRVCLDGTTGNIGLGSGNARKCALRVTGRALSLQT
jgi:hypothetical protein